MKSYSIQQKPCQFIAEDCSYQLQRYKNNLKKQMFLSENIEIAENISRVSRYLFPTKTRKWAIIHQTASSFIWQGYVLITTPEKQTKQSV